jgi:integrase
VRGLARFAERAGWPDEALADPRVIEAFCAQGLDGSTSATKGTYRSALRSWAGLADGRRARVGPSYSGAPAPVPYSPAERAELLAAARAQPTEHRRTAALVMMSAGLGAGLTAAELMALRGPAVDTDRDGLAVTVAGRRPRIIPVTAPHDARLATIAAHAGDRWLFRPGLSERGYKNGVCGLAESLATDPAAPRFTLGRARASFICDHIAAGTPAARLLAITGIVEAGSLARYAVHVAGAPASKGAWRARHAAEQQS